MALNKSSTETVVLGKDFLHTAFKTNSVIILTCIIFIAFSQKKKNKIKPK